MRINKLDLNQLACLDALLAERNVSRAAEHVHLSQPALSATLARMREYFDDPLLVRGGAGMTLTPFAQTLIEPVRDLLLQARALSRLRPQSDPKAIQRQITIACSDYVVHVLLGRLFARAEVRAPGLRFEVRSIAGYIGEELQRGDVDLVVSLASGMTPSHPSEVVMTDGFSCVVWTGNLTVGQRLSRRNYLALGHVVTVLGGGRVTTLDHLAMQAQGLERRIEVRVPAFTLLPTCVVGTQRIATLQTSLARMLEQQWPLRVLPCPVQIDPVVTAVQWHRYQTQDPAIVWVRSTLAELAATPQAGP